MGKIKQGILGGFSKKVGSVVGTSWKGIAVMKAMPQSVANPRTTAQVANRDNMSFVSKIGSQLLSPAIQECWNRWAKKMSGYNEWLKVNKLIVDGSDIASFGGNFEISNGELQLNNVALSGTQGASSTTFTFPTTLTGKYDKATDIIKAVGYVCNTESPEDPTYCYAFCANGSATRSAGTITLTYPQVEEGNTLTLLLYAVSADGKYRSESLQRFTIDIE